MKQTARWALGAGVGLLALAASLPAQALYKVVGPDGKVTYTDRPPADAGRAQVVSAPGAGSTGGGQALPYELRQVVARYPVTLYTSSDCQPCDAGRALLRQRGIPYTERTVSTAEDSKALARLTGGNELPTLQIGQQQVRGFSSTEWSSYLDAAGYPKQSLLPANYVHAPATPLVAVQPAPAAPAQPAAPAPAPARAAEAPPPPAGNAPPGFRF
ncbi:glutaredoxin family protein [Caldimonas thermodepolymerans]|uniref:Glutaredoxin n=1 Tax=Caldimonas thermodepolymerans TaxID=215580 RepID=A0AA46DHQ2_9BURK|nr:glutaredoxin family protein [Caldimonas thermodepolymerans]TCP09705.1 glutaredoxin [Caldimonas thermodepolymerans]UZG45823.1 glutaredoxin family protein [Caldimonas thermodepolymerans]UZG49717.1 glutaredoxin family protein [Caldimonas thermodepolymerans]